MSLAAENGSNTNSLSSELCEKEKESKALPEPFGLWGGADLRFIGQ